MSDDGRTTVSNDDVCGGMPASKDVRNRIRKHCRMRIEAQLLVPPLSLDAFKAHAGVILKELEFSEDYIPFVVVVFSNELWWPTVKRIPFDKRLLLIPQCLKHSTECTAEIDQLGLICKHCGRCVIDRITRRAEELGYAVLVAEGSPVVMAMIESGQVQATVGVSCLSVLERVFPYMEAGAVPGIAVPLLKDGCVDTVFDEDWLDEVLGVFVETDAGPVDLTQLKQAVGDWFEADRLGRYFGDVDADVERLGLDWVGQAGKRNRPMLTAGVYATLTGTDIEAIDDTVVQAAVAVECFHKASLIHDDIEDGDVRRYDTATLHEAHGVPIALNAGDYLIGQGYQLLTELECDAEKKVRLLQIAAEGHRQLCIGQGQELKVLSQETACSVEAVIDIFAKKTSPAFAVALKIGAVLGGCDDAMLAAMDSYSYALGVAYQIRDDLHDRNAGDGNKGLSIIQAIVDERDVSEEVAVKQAERMLEGYRDNAIASLEAIGRSGSMGTAHPTDCKGFLRKVITKIFDGDERMGCCDDEHTPESD